jgi:hypothetical protein
MVRPLELKVAVVLTFSREQACTWLPRDTVCCTTSCAPACRPTFQNWSLKSYLSRFLSGTRFRNTGPARHNSGEAYALAPLLGGKCLLKISWLMELGLIPESDIANGLFLFSHVISISDVPCS